MITTQQYMLIYCFASQIMMRVVMKSTDTEVRNLDTAILQIGRLVITAHQSASLSVAFDNSHIMSISVARHIMFNTY